MTKCDDPIECGHEAAIGQWESRWDMLRQMLNLHPHLAQTAGLMDRIEGEVPTGKRTGLPHQEIMRRTAELLRFEPDNHHNAVVCPYCSQGMSVIRMSPARVKRLVEVLRSAGAHPSGLGSYEAANDANKLADDIESMA